MGPRCDYHMYRYALESEPELKRLLDAVASSRDPVWYETFFLAMRYASGSDDTLTRMLGLLRRVESNEALWLSGAQVVADELSETSQRVRLTDEARRLWGAYPQRRGMVLYMVARADPYDNGDIPWKDFERDYGSLASASDFAAFLDRGPHAMMRAHTAWPALSKGWSRAQVIAPRLDRFLADPRAQAQHKAIADILAAMCAEGARDDLAQLHAWLSARVRSHPGESMGDLVAASAPEGCKAPRPRDKRPLKETESW
jgi:hypothetical protein